MPKTSIIEEMEYLYYYFYCRWRDSGKSPREADRWIMNSTMISLLKKECFADQINIESCDVKHSDSYFMGVKIEIDETLKLGTIIIE